MHFQCNYNYFLSVLFILFTTISICFVRSKETCDEDDVMANFEEVFEYQDNLDWRKLGLFSQENEKNELENWFNSVKNSEVHFDVEKCEDKLLDSHVEEIEEKEVVKPLVGPFPCTDINSVKYIGELDDEGKPHGPGTITNYLKPEVLAKNPKTIDKKEGIKVVLEDNSDDKYCYDLIANILSIKGNFENGILNGNAVITYTHQAFMNVNFVNGVIQGIVRGFDKAGVFEMIGNYYNGLPNGPFWIGNVFQENFTLLHLKNGQIIPQNVVSVNIRKNTGVIGTLVNGQFLEQAQDISVNWVADYKCLKIVTLPSIDFSKAVKSIKLPTYIESLISEKDQRIMVRPSDFLYFPRVAKTGSNFIINLLHHLDDKNEFVVVNFAKDNEVIWDVLPGKFEAVQDILSVNAPAALVRHYSFINFEEFGYKWRPDWINMVRDPIEKVISWFYYIRAGWYLVTKKTTVPGYVFPDVEYLKMTFEECVEMKHPECDFYQDKMNDMDGGHFSQILHFCGHLPVCRKFNSQEAFEIAKSNVEKYFTVVGITEQMQDSVTVMEAKLPKFFKGAVDLAFSGRKINEFNQTWIDVEIEANANHFKPDVAEDIKELVRRNFTYEIKFYEFCKERLQKQLSELK